MTSIAHDTVHTCFADAADRWPDRSFLNILPETSDIYGIPAGELCYSDAARQVTELSRAYAAAGFGVGHRVMLLLENRPVFFLHFLALNALGASIVPVNPDLRMAEQAYMIGHAEPALAVSIPTRVAELRKAAQKAGHAMPVITPDDDIPAPGANAIAATGEAALMYTSGTTGQPKGCVLDNTYFLLCGAWYTQTGGLMALGDSPRMITPLPIFHMNALACSFMAMITVGGCLTVLDRFHPRSWWALVRDSRATCVHYLGVMPSMLMGAPETTQDREHTVTFGFGAGIDPKLHGPFETRFGFPLIEAWAMTETGCGGVIAANHPPRRIGKSIFGVPAPEVEWRVVDDTDHDVAPGTAGELLVRRAGDDPRLGFFREYWHNPDATAEAWQGGWFHTGDVVAALPDGAMTFVDRKKNVIRRSGENIAAVEVESALMRHPDIAAVGVAAVPDAVRGDEVFACVVPKTTGDVALARNITQWCLTQLAYYKAPGYIAFVSELPLTATQKIQRAQLKVLAADLMHTDATHVVTDLKRRQVA